LGDKSQDENILNLVIYEIGANLEVNDASHARAWVQLKLDLIKGLFEEAVAQHGGKDFW
jgi:hypothetical protein